MISHIVHNVSVLLNRHLGGGCICNDYVDSDGYGQCKKPDIAFMNYKGDMDYKGFALTCYVDLPSSCPDLTNAGASLGKDYGRSAEACKKDYYFAHIRNKQFVPGGGNLWNVVAENGNIQLCKDKCMNNSFSIGHIPYQYCIGFYTYTDYYGNTRCQFKTASATMQCEDATGTDMYIITKEENFTCA